MGPIKRIIGFCKREAVLCIAALCSVVTMFFVPPSAAYVEYIDFRVLALLFCLMAVVAGFQGCGLFSKLAEKLLAGKQTLRRLSLLLVLLPFFSSMLVTNDVALITFVPFAILTLGLTGYSSQLPRVVVLQTVAANLGSMATPVGNPQNLFLYSFFTLEAGEFFLVVLPLTLLSLLLLVPCALWVPAEPLQVKLEEPGKPLKKGGLVLYGVLFVLCLLTVFHLLPWELLLGAVVLVLLILDRKVLLQVDYYLLLTFVCFFLFAGNLGQIPAARELLVGWMEIAPMGVSAGASQVISNVPAAVLLAEFTGSWQSLLAGVNIGGLGTPVASLASLISMKLYLRAPGAKGGKYLLLFTVVNVVFFVILFAAAAFLLQTL